MKLAKKIGYILFLGLIGVCSAQLQIPGEPTIYNDDQNQYVDSTDISNPIRD